MNVSSEQAEDSLQPHRTKELFMNVLRHTTHRTPRAFILEPIESRRHLTVLSWTNDFLSDDTGAYFGQVQFGSDGDPNGYATGISGVGETQETWSFTTWDANLQDGLDSTWRPVTFALNNKTNGDMSFKVGLGSTLTFNVGSSVVVNSVTFCAAVQGAFMEMDWRSISVKFYSGSAIVESDTVPNFGA